MQKLQLEFGSDNTILRDISSEVRAHEFGQYKNFFKAMLKYVKNPKHKSVWLAAPQVGLGKRIFVVSLMSDYSDEDFRTLVMINPTITPKGSETTEDEEWCLSLPWEAGTVRRWRDIVVDFLDVNQKKYSLPLSGLSARIVQHEFDHINGILFTDRMEENSKKIPLEIITREEQLAYLEREKG